MRPLPVQTLAFLLSAVIVIVCPGRCGSQTAVNSAYTIGPSDIISLKIIAGGEEQVGTDLAVSASGEITVPFIGKVQAQGMTVTDLELALYKPLEKDYFVDPQVHIRVKEYHSLQYSISGSVKAPGMYELDFHPTLMDLITKAGGVIKERGNLAFIIRGTRSGETGGLGLASGTASEEPIKVDLGQLLDNGDLSSNISLSSGDMVYIPLDNKYNPTQSKIYVEGRVKRPDVFDFQPGLTALSAVIMAGGFDKYAAPNRTRIIRPDGDSQAVIEINLEKVKTGETMDFPLEPGDRIHVPESWL